MEEQLYRIDCGGWYAGSAYNTLHHDEDDDERKQKNENCS
jgi:hypothetical protein